MDGICCLWNKRGNACSRGCGLWRPRRWTRARRWGLAFAAEPVRSSVDLPPGDNSAMDGYAVRSADLASARTEAPVALRVIGTAPAGVVLGQAVEQGTCARVFTGSMLPRGADAVVMQEDVKQNSEDPSRVSFVESAPAGENIRRRGEDVRAGELLLEAGEKLTQAPLLSFLAAAGISRRARWAQAVGRVYWPQVTNCARRGSLSNRARFTRATGLVWPRWRARRAQ